MKHFEPEFAASTWRDANERYPQKYSDELNDYIDALVVAATGLDAQTAWALEGRELAEAAVKLRDLSLVTVHEVWERMRPFEAYPENLERYVFHVALLLEPDGFSPTLPMRSPAPETLEWLWFRGVEPALPGSGALLALFIDTTLERGRQRRWQLNRSQEATELLDELYWPTRAMSIWDELREQGLADTNPRLIKRFCWVVATFLAPRIEPGRVHDE